MDSTRCLDDIDPDFKYTHANVSHSWLLNYPDKLKPDPNTLKVSSKNETYVEHDLRPKATKGKRKQLMEAFFRQVVSKEVLANYNTEEVIIEDYETDYTEHFKNPDDLPLPGETHSKNEKYKMQGYSFPNEVLKKNKLEELKAKYPLYVSAPVTFITHVTGRDNFRKNSTITKPPEENYDNREY